MASVPLSDPRWLTFARKMLGVHEGVGSKDNPAVVQLFKDAGSPEVIHDEVPWCAAFVNAMFARAGLVGTRSLWALDFAKWGKPLTQPALGAVAVKKRFNSSGKLVGGHVFFVVGWNSTHYYGLGGNQSDRVSIVKYPRSVIVALRWPKLVPVPTSPSVYIPPSSSVSDAGSES